MMHLKGCLWHKGSNGLGVGPMWLRRWLPYRKRFDKAARKHDAEYDEQGDWKDRREDDILFLQSLLQASETTLQVSVAVVYFYLVRLFGWLFYRYKK